MITTSLIAQIRAIGMERVLRAIPTQRQREHRTQDCNRAEQVDSPEPTAVPVSIVERPLVESVVLGLNSREELRQSWRCLRRGQRLEGFQPYPDQQQTLDCLVQRHSVSQPTSS